MNRGRDAKSQEAFRQDLASVFTALNELMSSRLPDITVQVGCNHASYLVINKLALLKEL